jgi:hypothetical protein
MHFLIGAIASSMPMNFTVAMNFSGFNFTEFNIMPTYLKNMTLTETLSATPTIIPIGTPFLNNYTNSSVGDGVNTTVVANTTALANTTSSRPRLRLRYNPTIPMPSPTRSTRSNKYTTIRKVRKSR